jgi:subtilisin family serine protease
MKRLLVALWLALCSGAALAQIQSGDDLPRLQPADGARRLSDAVAAPPEQHEILVMFHLPAPHFRSDGYGSVNYREDAGRSARQRLAAAVAREHQLELLEDWAMPVLNVDCYRMRVPAGMAVAPILQALQQDRRVEWAQQIQNFAAQAAADPLLHMQPAAQAWQLNQVRRTATGRKVLVAVVDSGVESQHPDLAGQVLVEQNFVDGQSYLAELHGTAVAGVIVARADNGVGIAGVAPEAHIMALRACWQAASMTRCNSFTLAKALNYALSHGAQVINLSLSGPADRLLQQLLGVALARGIRIVGAVDPGQPDGGFPANVAGVFAVASDGSPLPAGLAAWQAPGRDIPTTMPGGRWGVVNGSSYAAAHISGMLALMEELKPQLSDTRLRDAIVFNDSPSRLTSIDLCATLFRISGKCSCACPTSSPQRLAH